MKKLLICFGIIMLFLISLVNALDCRIARQGQPFIITAVADNSSQVNLTKVIYPNSSIALLGQFPMTKNGTNYNYTFTSTNDKGIYFYVTCGDEDGILTCQDTTDRCFEITTTGNQLNTPQMILYIIVLLIVILLFFLSAYGGIITPFENQRNQNSEVISINWKKYLKIFCWGLSYMFLIAIVFITWNLIYAYSQWDNIGKFFHYLYRLLILFAIPVLIGLWLMFFINYLNDKKIEKYIKRMGMGYNG